jgi:hypothetical protein
MFHLLDATLTSLLGDAAMRPALQQLYDAEVSFMTPEKSRGYTQETLDLFLYETKENRELRENEPIIEQRNGLSIRRRPPLRVDCSYMVTAWSKKSGEDKITAEHQLLGQAFNWLSRFPEIPQKYLLAGALAGQVFAPPTLVAQMDPVKNAGEFWVALGIPPRPFFNLVVTITMDLDRALEEFIVTSALSTYRMPDPASAEQRILIGGTVRDSTGRAVRDAWVRLEPAGATAVTDAAGHFIFGDVTRGPGHSLLARAPGVTGQAELNNFEIPAASGSYDLKFN